MNQRDDRARAKTRAHTSELPRNVYAHENRRDGDGQETVNAQVVTDLGAHCLHSQYMSLVAGTVSFVERTFDARAETANVPDFFKSDQELILSLGAKILHGYFAQF